MIISLLQDKNCTKSLDTDMFDYFVEHKTNAFSLHNDCTKAITQQP